MNFEEFKKHIRHPFDAKMIWDDMVWMGHVEENELPIYLTKPDNPKSDWKETQKALLKRYKYLLRADAVSQAYKVMEES